MTLFEIATVSREWLTMNVDSTLSMARLGRNPDEDLKNREVTVDIPLPNKSDGPATQPPQKPQRLFYIDWVRATVIALVVAFHCIDLFFDYTYSAAVYLGIVNQPPSDATQQVAIVAAQLMQSWFMGLLFLLSGYFTRPSYDRKGPLLFVADRALRLLLPLLVYDCFLQPLAFEVARHSSSAPEALQAAPNGFTYYYNTQFVRLGHGAGWFIAVLFIFDMVYAGVRVCVHGCRCLAAALARKCSTAPASDTAACSVGKQAETAVRHQSCNFECTAEAAAGSMTVREASRRLQVQLPPELLQPPMHCHSDATKTGASTVGLSFSATTTAAGVLGLGAVIAALCLLVRVGVLIPLGLQQSLWVVQGIQFQPAYLPQYVVAFLVGLAAHRPAARDGLQCLPSGAGPVAAVAAAGLAVCGGFLLSYFPGSNFGHELQHNPSVNYVAVFTVWEQFYAVTMWLAMLVCFRRCANKAGRAGAAVSSAAYAVYLVHVPVVSALGLAFAPVTWHPAAKCAVVTPLAVVCSWLIGLLLKQIPGVKHVL